MASQHRRLQAQKESGPGVPAPIHLNRRNRKRQVPRAIKQVKIAGNDLVTLPQIEQGKSVLCICPRQQFLPRECGIDLARKLRHRDRLGFLK